MKYMLMMHAAGGTGDYQVTNWAPEDLLEMAGDRARAIVHFRAAAERTMSIPERDYLTAKAARLVRY